MTSFMLMAETRIFFNVSRNQNIGYLNKEKPTVPDHTSNPLFEDHSLSAMVHNTPLVSAIL